MNARRVKNSVLFGFGLAIAGTCSQAADASLESAGEQYSRSFAKLETQAGETANDHGNIALAAAILLKSAGGMGILFSVYRAGDEIESSITDLQTRRAIASMATITVDACQTDEHVLAS